MDVDIQSVMRTDDISQSTTELQNGESEPPPNHRIPGRKTRPAYTARRRSWYGWGQTGTGEKSTFGQFLHDIPFIYAEIAILSLPTLAWVAITVPISDSGFGVSGSVFIGWTAMTLVATSLHMGLVRPLATDILGWVTITPSLIGLRFVYYNFVLLLAAYGSVALAVLIGYPPLSLAISVATATLAMLLFPRLCESVIHRRSP